MHPRVDVSQPDKVTYITILLTLSEPQRILEQKQKLIDNFKIGDILVTDPVPGSIDQYLTIYGKPTCITKCLMYVIYYLNVIMHINYDLFTFKTANYKFTILLNSQNLKFKHNLKYLDIAQYSESIYSGFIQEICTLSLILFYKQSSREIMSIMGALTTLLYLDYILILLYATAP